MREEHRSARQLRATGFRLLVQTGKPVPQVSLARAVHRPPKQVAASLAHLTSRGAARLDTDGALVAIAGLSVVPDRHAITAQGRRFWTWCAYDALGILAALEADGELETADPYNGTPITIRFTAGRPQRTAAVLFLPVRQEDTTNIDWCPNANLFTDTAAAVDWSRSEQVDGSVLPLPDAVRTAVDQWRPIVSSPSTHPG